MPMPERQPDPDDAQRPGTTTDTGSSARNGDSDNGLDAALESSSGPPASKRRRIGLACNSCRVRKSRCDGQRPSCASCLSLGFDCIYEPSESATNVIVRKDYVSDLEQRVCLIEDRLQRVSFLEDRLQRINDVLKGHLSPCLNDSTGPLNLNHHQHHQQHARAALTSSTTLTTTTTAAAATRHANGSTPSASSSAAVPPHTHETCATSLEEPRDEDAHPNGMAMVFIEEQSSAFFGESSNINFTQQLLRAVATVHQGGFPANEAPAPAFGTTHSQPYHPLVSSSSSSSSILLSSSSSTSPVDTLPTALPSVDEMDSLLTIFFDTAGSVFPFIHEPTLRDTYNECRRNGFTRARRTWLGTLNMMFAMAANFDRERTPSARKRYERANVFYKRANELCGDLSRRVISLEIVHYLLLVVIHCQGTQRSVQAWNYHGLVVRSAMALGLHRDPTADRSDFGGGGGGGGSGGTPLGPVQQEAHRRTWVVIYILDKILSTAFGRPASVPDEQIMTRRDLINLDLSRTSTTATTTTTTTTASGSSEAATAATAAATAATDDLPGEFLRVSFTLYHIMGRSLHLQYGANLVNAAASWEVVDGLDSLKASGELRRALQGWAASLPLHMRICEHTGSRVLHHNTPGNHLRVILTLRYYNLGILIHKPLLSATLRHVFLSPSSLSSSSSSADPTATSSGSPPPYLVQLTMAEAHECTRAAHVTIELVHAVITEDATGRNNLGQWFYTLYYVFTASLVVCARMLWAQHGQQQQGMADKAAVDESKVLLAKVETIFHNLDQDNNMVQSCLDYIRRLGRMCSIKAPYHTGLEHGSGHDVEGGARGGAAGGGDYDLRAGADSMMPLMSVEDTEAFQLFTSEMFDPSIFEELQQSPHENRSQPMSTGHHHHHHLGQHQHQQQYYLHHEAPHTRHLQHDASGGQDKSDGSSHGLW